MAEKKNILTYEGLRALEEELQDLKVNRRKQVAVKIKEAREQGDLSENAEYDAARNEQAIVEARILELEQMIEKSSIQKDIVIPATGWLNGAVGGGRYIDITQDFITEKMIPFVSIFPEDMTVARICGMSTAAETKNKILRLYAEKAPSREINASLLLLRTTPLQPQVMPANRLGTPSKDLPHYLLL